MFLAELCDAFNRISRVKCKHPYHIYINAKVVKYYKSGGWTTFVVEHDFDNVTKVRIGNTQILTPEGRAKIINKILAEYVIEVL